MAQGKAPRPLKGWIALAGRGNQAFMNALHRLAVAAALVSSAAFADSHHHSHHSSSSSKSLDVCLKWAEVPADGGVDAGEAFVSGDEPDVDPDGGFDVDGGAEPADAGVARTVRVCVEHGPALGCSTMPGGAAGGMLALMAVLLRRRRT